MSQWRCMVNDDDLPPTPITLACGDEAEWPAFEPCEINAIAFCPDHEWQPITAIHPILV